MQPFCLLVKRIGNFKEPILIKCQLSINVTPNISIKVNFRFLKYTSSMFAIQISPEYHGPSVVEWALDGLNWIILHWKKNFLKFISNLVEFGIFKRIWKRSAIKQTCRQTLLQKL